MKVQQKLKSEPEEGASAQDDDDSYLGIKKEFEDLTPEDEERRRRRRERNKVAATKCRNKKKDKTVLLVAESEIVENQNVSLKAEVARLDVEKRRLTSLLAQHEPNCSKKRRLNSGGGAETATSGQAQEQLQQQQYDAHTFRRPAAPGGSEQRYAEPQGYSGYSTNQPLGAGHCDREEEEEADEAFKSEAKDYKHYSSGAEMYEVYSLMRQQPPPQLQDYSARALAYAGGYYDHMCLAL